MAEEIFEKKKNITDFTPMIPTAGSSVRSTAFLLFWNFLYLYLRKNATIQATMKLTARVKWAKLISSFTINDHNNYYNACCRFVSKGGLLTNRKEEQNDYKYAKTSFAPIKIVQLGGISAGVEHRCSHLYRLRTGVTWRSQRNNLVIYSLERRQHKPSLRNGNSYFVSDKQCNDN